MCGICGICFPDNRQGKREYLVEMNQMLQHRGPDSDGFYLNDGIGLAMRRLAIIDLTTGDQPVTNEAKSVWAVMNGEIYNFPDLRKDLEKRGHCFRTNTDSEILPHLYEEYGDDFLKHMRGMFAFALWDEKKQKCINTFLFHIAN